MYSAIGPSPLHRDLRHWCVLLDPVLLMQLGLAAMLSDKGLLDADEMNELIYELRVRE